MNVVVAAFNQEKALVGAFYVIIYEPSCVWGECHCQTELVWGSMHVILSHGRAGAGGAAAGQISNLNTDCLDLKLGNLSVRTLPPLSWRPLHPPHTPGLCQDLGISIKILIEKRQHQSCVLCSLFLPSTDTKSAVVNDNLLLLHFVLQMEAKQLK